MGCSLSKVNCTCKDSVSATPQTPHFYSTEQRRNPMGRGQRVSKGAGLGTRVQAYVLTIPFGEKLRGRSRDTHVWETATHVSVRRTDNTTSCNKDRAPHGHQFRETKEKYVAPEPTTGPNHPPIKWRNAAGS